jgi:hypothetical protein
MARGILATTTTANAPPNVKDSETGAKSGPSGYRLYLYSVVEDVLKKIISIHYYLLGQCPRVAAEEQN